jgi:hypothetical protein
MTADQIVEQGAYALALAQVVLTGLAFVYCSLMTLLQAVTGELR